MNTYHFNFETSKYKKQLQEQIENEKTREIIEILTDENFGSDGQRRKFVDLITSLFNIADKDARKFMRELGKKCTDVGNEMLGDRRNSENEELESPEEETMEIEYEKEEPQGVGEVIDFPPYMFRKSGTMVYESIYISPLSDEDAREIQVYLRDESIKFRNTRNIDLLPIIEVCVEKGQKNQLLEKLNCIAIFDEV